MTVIEGISEILLYFYIHGIFKAYLFSLVEASCAKTAGYDKSFAGATVFMKLDQYLNGSDGSSKVK